MRLNDRIVVAAISLCGIIGVSIALTAERAAAFQDPVPLVTIKKFTNGQDADVAPGPSIAVGDPVTWTYVVTNTWTGTLTGIVVSDDMGVAVDCNNVRNLASGESLTCTGTGVATEGQYANVGTVTALAGMGAAMASDPSHYFGVGSASGGDVSSTGKVAVCHRNRPGDFVLIQVAVAAEPAHVAHGDGAIGGAVPGQSGMVFGPDCVVTSAPQP